MSMQIDFVTVQHAHACFEACVPPVNGCVSDALLNAAVQNIFQALSQNILLLLNDVSNTPKT